MRNYCSQSCDCTGFSFINSSAIYTSVRQSTLRAISKLKYKVIYGNIMAVEAINKSSDVLVGLGDALVEDVRITKW